MPQSPGKFLGRAFLALLAVLPVYLYGVLASGILAPVGAEKLCQGEGEGVLDLRDPIQDQFFPLSLTCRWQDGTSTQQVPPIVNPLIFLLFAAAVVLVVLGLRAMARDRSRTPV
jgi:hypothetical protein